MRRLSIVQVLGLAACLGGCQTLEESMQWKPGDQLESKMAQSPSAVPADARASAEPVPVEAVVQPTKTLTVEHPAQLKYSRSDEPVRRGMEHFARGDYGLAERDFQEAVEKNPRDPIAWASLAASYDRLARFDLADRAYRQAILHGGETVQVLNNQGYSYMLRGNTKLARQKFAQALALDPENPRIINNLRLLDSARVYIDDKDRRGPVE